MDWQEAAALVWRVGLQAGEVGGPTCLHLKFLKKSFRFNFYPRLSHNIKNLNIADYFIILNYIPVSGNRGYDPRGL